VSTILVVDDDDEIRTLLRLILEAEGHDAIEAANAEEGLAALDLKPEAIFVDVDMPGMSGAQFLVALRQHPLVALTPATFVTAHEDRVALFAKHGIAEKHIISKPFRRKDIRDALGRMLGSLKRRNLRVSLHPGDLSVDVDGNIDATVMRLSESEVFVRGGAVLKVGSGHTLRLRSGGKEIACQARVTNRLRGETRFAVQGDLAVQKQIKALISELLHDSHAHENVRGAERVPLSASITWERAGARDVGYLRDLSASGCYIVTTTRPALEETVMVYLPWHSRDRKAADKTMELRGAEAKVARVGSDGFGCMFTGENLEFFVALNALLSDGTVISGQGRDH